MRHRKDYQQPWTLPFGLMEQMGLLAGSKDVSHAGDAPDENISVQSWTVDGASDPDATLDDWFNNGGIHNAN